jgi:hypothetical protein
MIRFFLRIGTIRLQGTIYDLEEPIPYAGDIGRLLESLRHVSSYQIDRNHAHCGLRVRIIPLLDLIEKQLNVDTANHGIGLCSDCWFHHRKLSSWASAKRPFLWTPSRLLTNLALTSEKNGHRRTPSSCLERHIVIRDMFMAAERDWTASDI